MAFVSDYTSILSGFSWNGTTVGRGTLLTYSFSTAASQDLTAAQAASFVPLSAADQAIVRNALGQWAAASGVIFKEVVAHKGDLAFGDYDLTTFNLGPADVLGFAYAGAYVKDQTGAIVASTTTSSLVADVSFERTVKLTVNTALHEIGHALGLKHPFAPFLDATAVLDPALDTGAESVMSYKSLSSVLGPFDVQAIQVLYGAKGASLPYAETFDPVTESVSITGSTGPDFLHGTSGNDVIDGNGGPDAIDAFEGDDLISIGTAAATVEGGTGIDTVITGYPYYAPYSLNVFTPNTLVVVNSPDRSTIQTLRNVEFVRFPNGQFDVAANTFTPSVGHYTFAGASGDVTSAAAWRVDATGAPAAFAPTQYDTVTIGTATLTGTAGYAAASLSGQVKIGGFLTTASLQVGKAALETLVGGNVLASGSVTLAGGSFVADANSGLSVGGTATARTADGSVFVFQGGTVSGYGTVTASYISDAGTLIAAGGTLHLVGQAYAGAPSSVVQIATGGTLWANLSGATIAFTGLGAAFKVDTYVQNDILTGFGPGDSIIVPSATAVSSTPGKITIDTSGARYTFAVTNDLSQSVVAINALGAVTVSDPLFDAAYYLAANPDVRAAGIDPYQHYMTFGWREGRDPSATFSTTYYLTHNPDVAAAGLNPLLHFEANGWREGRDPSAGFSLRDYAAAYPDVAAAGIDPLLQFVTAGRASGRVAFGVPSHAPDPLVDASYYWARNPDVRAAGVDATDHYLANGWKEGRNPDAWFDTRYYLAQNPDVKAAGIDPLLHFEAIGWREGREPSLVFSDSKYLQAYPDVAAAGLDPLVHYLANGQAEGRATFLTGGAAAADPLVNAAYYDAQLGATLLPTGTAAAQQAASSYDRAGWQAGLNPDAYFDTAYYLSHNPDVAAAHINPLLHYETNGWREGRDPSALFSTNKYLAAYADVRRAGIDPLLHFVVNGQGEGRSAFHV